jgi:hypothetical protein
MLILVGHEIFGLREKNFGRLIGQDREAPGSEGQQYRA